MSIVIVIIAVVLVGGAFAWWLLITTEGVYLGRGVVVWLYDIYARRYDRIKNYDDAMESATLGRPILRALLDIPTPLVLDVATGTARLPLAVMGQPAFKGEVIGLDYSRRMLAVAAEKIALFDDRVSLIHQDATHLPFDDNTFDAVTCLEALEFTPDSDAVIAEIVRVARPGALILITNRKGFDARLMVGKTQPSKVIAARLRDHFGLEDVTITIWQVEYDQLWAFKAGESIPAPRARNRRLTVLRCLHCGQRALQRPDDDPPRLICGNCAAQISIGSDGVIDYASTVMVNAV